MAKRKTNRVRFEPGSGNVFADLGFPDAAELDTKARRLAARLKHPRAARRAKRRRPEWSDADDAPEITLRRWRGPLRRPRLSVVIAAEVSI